MEKIIVIQMDEDENELWISRGSQSVDYSPFADEDTVNAEYVAECIKDFIKCYI